MNATLFRFAAAGLFAATIATTSPAANFAEVVPVRLTAEQRVRLEDWLKSQDANYDPGVAMLQSNFSSPGYHTTLTGGVVHRTRESLTYALALLDSGTRERRERAAQVIAKVLTLQDADRASPTYGVWPWFLEEPLAKMSPPDRNWADFCGVTLLQIAREHRGALPPPLVASIDAAIVRAAEEIKERNVGPDYTNIALMGAYVTRLAGEHYGRDDLATYGAERLERFQRQTKNVGAFSEYNSPTYTIVALDELGRMRRDFTDPKLREIVAELYHTAWEEIALHYHVPSGQWAGPHSRAYQTFVSGAFYSLIEEATGGAFKSTAPRANADYRRALECPPDLQPYFLETKSRTLARTFGRGTPDIVGTTVITPSYALGSINRGDFWNQRRPLLVYWGDRAQPSFARVRVLRNGYDFAAAQFRSVQADGRVLGAIGFATDGGVTHVSLDRMKESRFTARDLRLRFELGGAAAAESRPLPSAPTEHNGVVTLASGNVQVRAQVGLAVFGAQTVRWETGRTADEGRDGKTAYVDLVLHAGAEETFNLKEIAAAGLVLAFEVGEKLPPVLPLEVKTEAGVAQARWGELTLNAPLKPASAAALRR